jgi:hypothetical protein
LIDRPVHQLAGPSVEHHAAKHTAISGEVLDDVGHPQHARAVTVEVVVQEIGRGGLIDRVSPTLAALWKPTNALLAHDYANQLLVCHMVMRVSEFGLHATPPVGAP